MLTVVQTGGGWWCSNRQNLSGRERGKQAWAQKREKKRKKETLTNEHIVFSECSNFTEALKAAEEFGLRLLHLSKRGCLAS